MRTIGVPLPPGHSDESERLAALSVFEAAARHQGFSRIAGVDEAGRGPLAGPIVAAAVVLSWPIAGLDDSKRLSPEERNRLFDALTAGPHAFGIGQIAAEEIDRQGIQWANYRAMALAVARIHPPPDFLLIDGFQVPGLSPPQQRLVKGDQRSISIAAASILAKVTRDRIMVEVDRTYPEYGFARHKGYGTREHLEALARYGPCPEHRKSFAPLAQPTETGRLFESSE